MGLFSWAKRRSSGGDSAAAKSGTSAAVKADTSPSARGVAFLNAGNLFAARDAFREAIAHDPASAAHHVNLAYVLQQTDAEAEALNHLQEAVELDLDSFDAHYMLGGALERVPELEGAAEHFGRAAALRPGFAQGQADLCRVLSLTGDTVGARAAIDAAIALEPRNADFRMFLGNLCMAEGEAQAALENYEQALELRPDQAVVYVNKGLAFVAQKNMQEALASFDRALEIDPRLAEAHVRRGLAFKTQYRFTEAAEALQQAVEIDPENAATLNELGQVLIEQGLADQAISCYRRSIELRPDRPGAYSNLGLALYQKGDVGAAIDAYRAGLKVQPVAELHDNLGIALVKVGAVDEGIEQYRNALALRPDNLNTQCNLASALADGGGPKQAIAAFRDILQLRPDHVVAHHNLLFHLAVDEDCSPEDYLAEARRFDKGFPGEPLGPFAKRNDDASRRLRVGFVSADLRNHPVGFFIEGILHHLDATKLELFAYPTGSEEDQLSARIKPRFARWITLKGLRDETAARMIRDDGIDILLDLSGHTADTRLPMFAYRPAPVQIGWLGYFASTGLSAMDYVLADDVCVPLGNEYQFSEKVWRLPDTRLCFTPPEADAAPDVAALPGLTRGYPTFGSFQRLSKLTDSVLDLWSQVLRAVPDARLFLQSIQAARPKAVAQILDRLSKVGITADRVTVRAPAGRMDYFRAYSEVDIVLDTFPYTGGTTTCEALWMGVPTLTMTGHSMIARQGVSMMRAAGLSGWVAEDQADYVRKAVQFAADLDGLARLRASMRGQVSTTTLFDTCLFARRLEEALSGIWREHLLDVQTSHVKQPASNVLTQTVVT